MTVLRVVFVLMLFMTLCHGRRRNCRRLPDCKCGDFCVERNSNMSCLNGYNCVCKTGCIVFNTFLPAGSRSRVHCNLCSCPVNPPIPDPTTGIPACTRVAWCDAPPGTDVYPSNPSCQRRGYGDRDN
ncbi:uncharacterized protein LOC128221994 [Mya arenaria]|uniref:uncharacterized protein LOC128221994 n=1 Tax=Mya arenaria TaxID=6604 RepID=UPI0022E74529|nr:uncharacterized protein LOC128221994 [Mya arenaria]